MHLDQMIRNGRLWAWSSVCGITAVMLLHARPSQAAEPSKPVRRPTSTIGTNAPVSAKVLAKNHPTEALKAWLAQLPPPPEGVSDLHFNEFFRTPVGPLGLELTQRLSDLSGKRVRILGYQVKQSRPTPWTLLLAPMPLVNNEVEFGLAEDLPPNVVRVFVPRDHRPVVPHSNGLLLLTGRLEVGDREEPDGKHSLVRLHLDRDTQPPADSPKPLSASDELRR